MSIGEQDQALERIAGSTPAPLRPASLRAMLEARSVALVGASPRPGSFGQRMIHEVGRSPARPDIYLVNPRYRQIGGRPCYPSLAELPGPADLVLLGVPDTALEEQLSLAARCRSAAAVIFGNAHEDPPPATPDGGSSRPGPGRQPPGPARASGRDRARGRDAAVRGRLHGVRQRGPRPAGDRLRRAGPAAGRPGRAGHPFGVGVLRDAAQRPGHRVHPGGVLRAGTRHPGRRLPGVHAGPAGNPGARAGARGDARAWPAAGRRWRMPMACTGSATWPSWRTRWSCSRSAAAPSSPPPARHPPAFSMITEDPARRGLPDPP